MKTLFAYFFGPNGLDKKGIEITEGPTGGSDQFGAPFAPPTLNPLGVAQEPPSFDDYPNDAPIEADGFPTRQVQKLEGEGDTREPFVWETNDVKFLGLRAMATPHLFYTLRMIFNHSVPPAFRVGKFRRRANVDRWSLDYREQAGHEIRVELRKRADLEPWMKDEVQDMVANAAYLDGNPPSWQQQVQTYVETDGLTTDEIRKKLPRTATEGSWEEFHKRYDKRAMARAKRMKRAVPTTLAGFPQRRCMEHRSYAGIRKPRIDCKACAQVYRARRRNRRNNPLWN